MNFSLRKNQPDFACASINRFLLGRKETLISDITPEEIQEYISTNGWLPATMRSYLVDVRTLFAFAVKRKYIRENTALAVELPKVDENPPAVVSPDQATGRHCITRVNSLSWASLKITVKRMSHNVGKSLAAEKGRVIPPMRICRGSVFTPMKFFQGVLFLLISGAFPAICQTAQADAKWKLVWSDEFSQPDGSSPDSSNWTFDIGAGGWGNRELQYYTSRTNNVRIERSNLVIEARQENFSGSSYTSARLKTQGKKSWTYGRIEARIKIPRGQGIWPAFWTLGTNFQSVGWPGCGEIDIMENIGKEPKQIHGTVHGPGYSGGAIGGVLSDNRNFADDFHIYAVEWTTNRISWFVDDVQYFTANPTKLPKETKWVFFQPQFLLLNVAVGGSWPGHPDETTLFPQKMWVDYVRVYKSTTDHEPSAKNKP